MLWTLKQVRPIRPKSSRSFPILNFIRCRKLKLVFDSIIDSRLINTPLDISTRLNPINVR